MYILGFIFVQFSVEDTCEAEIGVEKQEKKGLAGDRDRARLRAWGI